MFSSWTRTAIRLALAYVLITSAAADAWADTPGQRLPGARGKRETTAAIMERQAEAPPRGPRPEHELEYPDRSGLPQNPNALPVSSFPAAAPGKAITPVTEKVHTTSLSFNGATLTDTGAFP